MKFNQFAYLFLGPQLDPNHHRTQIKTNRLTFITIGFDFYYKDQAIEVAKELVESGTQQIELCEGFGPFWITRISEAIKYRVPVGSVSYGPEARKLLSELMS